MHCQGYILCMYTASNGKCLPGSREVQNAWVEGGQKRRGAETGRVSEELEVVVVAVFGGREYWVSREYIWA